MVWTHFTTEPAMDSNTKSSPVVSNKYVVIIWQFFILYIFFQLFSLFCQSLNEVGNPDYGYLFKHDTFWEMHSL